MPIGGGCGSTRDFGETWDGLGEGTKWIIIRNCGYDPDDTSKVPWENIPEEAKVLLQEAYSLYDSDPGD